MNKSMIAFTEYVSLCVNFFFFFFPVISIFIVFCTTLKKCMPGNNCMRGKHLLQIPSYLCQKHITKSKGSTKLLKACTRMTTYKIKLHRNVYCNRQVMHLVHRKEALYFLFEFLNRIVEIKLTFLFGCQNSIIILSSELIEVIRFLCWENNKKKKLYQVSQNCCLTR